LKGPAPGEASTSSVSTTQLAWQNTALLVISMTENHRSVTLRFMVAFLSIGEIDGPWNQFPRFCF
jgi:hypothetical protein